MQSKTFCCNKTVFKKDLTRFAPAWGLYTLCLILGLVIMYSDNSNKFWFASNMAACIPFMGAVNLVYAPIVVQLLFGDLYNSRMCNALHAMPLSRESWYLTHVLSGLTFSLVPTLVMALLSVPLLMGTVVNNAWQLSLLWFLGANLQYLCFFGIALFCALCVGNRLAMGLVYGVIHCAAYFFYGMADIFYTPMLYGVVTPSALADALSPWRLAAATYVELESYSDLLDRFLGREEALRASFQILWENWVPLFCWTLAGVGFLLLGLVLYRRRKLECAGDVAAVRGLDPIFSLAAALAEGFFGYVFIGAFFGISQTDLVLWLVLLCGLSVGWFAGRMLIARSTRVFTKKNFLGLGSLVAVLALSLGLTYYDVFRIDDWIPKADKVRSVTVGNYQNWTLELTEQEDIQAILRLSELVLEDRVERSGHYTLDGETVVDYNYVQAYRDTAGPVATVEAAAYVDKLGAEEYTPIPVRNAASVYLEYNLNSGRTVRRRYNLWFDQEEADIAREYLSRWEMINRRQYDTLEELDLDLVNEIYIERATEGSSYIRGDAITRELIDSLLAAIQADCAERTIAQSDLWHTGHFKAEMETEEGTRTYCSTSLSISLYEDNHGFGLQIYPDSRNTLAWLESHGYLTYTVHEETVWPG